MSPLADVETEALEAHVPQLRGGRGALGFESSSPSSPSMLHPAPVCLAQLHHLLPSKHPEVQRLSRLIFGLLVAHHISHRATSCGQEPPDSNQEGSVCLAVTTQGEETPQKELVLLVAGCSVTFRPEGQVTNESSPLLGLSKRIYYLQPQSVGLVPVE